jgi:hypothetical protein
MYRAPPFHPHPNPPPSRGGLGGGPRNPAEYFWRVVLRASFNWYHGPTRLSKVIRPIVEGVFKEIYRPHEAFSGTHHRLTIRHICRGGREALACNRQAMSFYTISAGGGNLSPLDGTAVASPESH